MAVDPFDNADEARLALREIVAEYGIQGLSDPPMVSRLLSDLLPGTLGVARIITAAVEHRVADSIREHLAQGMDTTTAIRMCARSFAASTMFTPEVCTWVVSEFAVVLAETPIPGGRLLPEQEARTVAPPVDETISAPAGIKATVGAADTVVPDAAGGSALAGRSPEGAKPTNIVTDNDAPVNVSVSNGPANRPWRGPVAVIAVLAVVGAVALLVSRSSPPKLPVSAAVLTGTWRVQEQVIKSGDVAHIYRAPKRWRDTWRFTPTCGSGPCSVRFSGTIHSHSITGTLARSGATYVGTIRAANALEQCKNSSDAEVQADSLVTVRIKIRHAADKDGTWRAQSWQGTIHVTDSWNGNSNCSNDYWRGLIYSPAR